MESALLKNKIMGCWFGKNAGGTLGEPLEEKFGRKEMFSIDWYPSLPEGGIPNDDLELQLIFLQVLMEKGPGFSASDLVQEWLDCVNYNFDEYGLSKANMMLGLLPPVCGWHNNAFKDCMGSPIRSELWACVAPGNPDIAARYAFMDAVCDHSGGESVFGEIYNAVVQSMAFVEHDPMQLITDGLSAIPSSSLTSRCIKSVVEKYRTRIPWQQARNEIMKEFFHPVAQYSPINLGFQTIGWLYGENFGDALCKAVNCGWDTDCTAATLGATLGIIHGADGLPEKWLAPLGNTITTNMSTGGIKNLRAPTDIRVLTDVVLEQAEKVLAFWGRNTIQQVNQKTAYTNLQKIAVDTYTTYAPNAIQFEEQSLRVRLIYQDNASIIGNRNSRLSLELLNIGKSPYTVSGNLVVPPGFSTGNNAFCIRLMPNTLELIDLEIHAQADMIRVRNECQLLLIAEGRVALRSIPLVLVGGYRWAVSPVFPGLSLEDAASVDEHGMYTSIPAGFVERWFATNSVVAADDVRSAPGMQYFLHYIQLPTDREVVLGFPNTHRMRMFVNGEFVHETKEIRPLRPNMGNGGALGDLSNYRVVKLQAGWNQILIKWEFVSSEDQAHFVIGSIDSACIKNHGGLVMDAVRSQFPWK